MNRPVRVLWLSKGLGPGGAERLLVSLARSLDRERFDVRAAYLLPEKDHLVGELAGVGVASVCLGAGVRWLTRLRGLVEEFDPDVVHIHSPQPAALARPALWPLKRRPAILYTEHNSWDGYRLPTRLANALTFPLDDRRLAVSQTALDSIPRFLRGETEVLVHGVDLEAVRSRAAGGPGVRSELGMGPDEVLVVTVANLREHKDYPNLLAAARLVADSRSGAGGGVRFVAVGQGPLEAEVRADIERLGLGGVFDLLGYRPDALEVLAAADVFCLSSVAEGYPVSLMEALALGKPVVATAVGGIPEAMRDGVEGLLVPARSASRLAEAILAVAGDRLRRQGMAAAARNRAELFDIRRAAARHEEIYSEMASERAERWRGR